MRKRKLIKKLLSIKSVDELDEYLKSIGCFFIKEDLDNIFNNICNNNISDLNISRIRGDRCSASEAYRRENNKPCPYCGNLDHKDSLVSDIKIKKHIYRLEMTCGYCHKKYITSGNKVKL